MESILLNELFFNCYLEKDGVVVAGLRCEDDAIALDKIASFLNEYKIVLSSNDTHFNLFLMKDGNVIAGFTEHNLAIAIYTAIKTQYKTHYKLIGLDYIDDLKYPLYYVNCHLHDEKTEKEIRQAALDKQNKARAERGEPPLVFDENGKPVCNE